MEWLAPRRRESRALEWDDEIGRDVRDEYQVVDHAWLEVEEIEGEEAGAWDPGGELVRYLKALYNPDEHVAYVAEAWDKDGRLVPTRGVWDRTAGQLIAELERYGTVPEVMGDPKPREAGAWIRFNPMDGKGCRDANVSSLRHALVESDEVEVERQAAIIRKLELPVTALVHSGGKSIHAIVKIDADTIEEYRKRVNFLYEVCARNGLPIDTANRNPSRLSRMPGVMRGDRPQRLLATNIGKADWLEWETWIEDLNDDLPEIERLSSAALLPENLPRQAPELIEGVLREGHKMRLAGPSKAGKSFALLQLAIAIAEGRSWMGWPCGQGRVLYVNLELDRASCWRRISDVYAAKGWPTGRAANIDIWNLRGRAMPMDKLTPRLIRRAREANYKAIIIDPIYKVLTGDENSAEEMAAFCNQFDRLCVELKCAVIDCHHHSKGSQGAKASRDRASGSGVFSRDPDALLDLIELAADAPREVMIANAVCREMQAWLDEEVPGWRRQVSSDDALVPERLKRGVAVLVTPAQMRELGRLMCEAGARLRAATAWRIEGTLREFAAFPPRNIWFTYPVHEMDEAGLLAEAKADGEEPPWKAERKASANEERAERKKAFAAAVTALSGQEGGPTKESVMEYLSISRSTFFSRMKQAGYVVDEGRVVKK